MTHCLTQYNFNKMGFILTLQPWDLNWNNIKIIWTNTEDWGTYLKSVIENNWHFYGFVKHVKSNENSCEKWVNWWLIMIKFLTHFKSKKDLPNFTILGFTLARRCGWIANFCFECHLIWHDLLKTSHS
jgi:hypothetical protein